jgi:hypothetical protein
MSQNTRVKPQYSITASAAFAVMRKSSVSYLALRETCKQPRSWQVALVDVDAVPLPDTAPPHAVRRAARA